MGRERDKTTGAGVQGTRELKQQKDDERMESRTEWETDRRDRCGEIKKT